ncbi:hypothetical protein Shyhy02_32140 [Streptomyces hygroscopicus subsp. hygroscopicus]|nr:hypothetical protein Shyhy02_32140 [Streptomyces hygroscopicus subsp. hygroscopicus]
MLMGASESSRGKRLGAPSHRRRRRKGAVQGRRGRRGGKGCLGHPLTVPNAFVTNKFVRARAGGEENARSQAASAARAGRPASG